MLDTCERYDVIEMIVRTHKKKEEEENKTRTNKSLAKQFFSAMNPQTSSYFQSC